MTASTTPTAPSRLFTLLDAGGQRLLSSTSGTLGGHRRSKIYGRLDCPAAARSIAAGGYVAHRVFFADEFTAVAAGYRPCAVCMPERYQSWKTRRRTGPVCPTSRLLAWSRLPSTDLSRFRGRNKARILDVALSAFADDPQVLLNTIAELASVQRPPDGRTSGRAISPRFRAQYRPLCPEPARCAR
jgi:hypothetical protein